MSVEYTPVRFVRWRRVPERERCAIYVDRSTIMVYPIFRISTCFVIVSVFVPNPLLHQYLVIWLGMHQCIQCHRITILFDAPDRECCQIQFVVSICVSPIPLLCPEYLRIPTRSHTARSSSQLEGSSSQCNYADFYLFRWCRFHLLDTSTLSHLLFCIHHWGQALRCHASSNVTWRAV